ncbi:winged helix-turn-helix domain-containing protein [Streptomyces daliensis]|uniref:Winged helix-turn-helix domain-containing protein n=1 Tax=Streptomyces daliensis TaxID=299421 RepID=A0A8T4ISE8_9ACTN|nr:winged helix-turn-helix domain-containing protein [Streptomyces daliensis]
MRYAQGGGLTAERQEFRERLRLQAAERFERGETNAVIAKDLRISVRSVQRWRRAWQQGGPLALNSKGPASRPRLSPAQFRELEAELAKGAAAHGWADQRWTLERIRAVIARRFHMTYTIQGVRKLLRRHGWSCQVSERWATGRETLAEGWIKQAWTQPEPPRRRQALRADDAMEGRELLVE